MGEGRVYTHGTLSAVQRRSDRAGAAELRGCQVRTTLRRFWNVAFGRLWNVGARQRVVTRYDDARPAEPPPWPPMWSQRPLQEDLSRYAENQPSCVRDVVVGKE